MELQAPAGTREWQKERERYPFTWSQQQEWQECRQGAARRTSSPRRRLKSGHTIFMLISTVIGFFICTGLQALYSLLVFLLIHKSHAYQIKKIAPISMFYFAHQQCDLIVRNGQGFLDIQYITTICLMILIWYGSKWLLIQTFFSFYGALKGRPIGKKMLFVRRGVSGRKE